jgi:hypothetical protein
MEKKEGDKRSGASSHRQERLEGEQGKTLGMGVSGGEIRSIHNTE